MNDYELAIRRCKGLEALLERGFGAAGKGLHERVTSVEDRLPPPLVKRLRFVATVRNKLVHDAGYTALDDRDGFVRACDEAERGLKELLPKVVNKGCFGLVLVAAVAAGAVRFLCA